MELKEKLAMLEEVMECEEGTLSPEMDLNDVEDYNSLAKLSLIVMMADEFNKKIGSEDIKKFVTVKDILDCME